jgi:hypothetical protein
MIESLRVQPRIEEIRGLSVVTFGIEGDSFQGAVEIGEMANSLRSIPESYRENVVRTVMASSEKIVSDKQKDDWGFYASLEGSVIQGTRSAEEDIEVEDRDTIRVFGAFAARNIVGLIEIQSLYGTEEDKSVAKFLFNMLGVQFPAEAKKEIEDNSGLIEVPFVGSIYPILGIQREVMAIQFNPDAAKPVRSCIENERAILCDPNYIQQVRASIGQTSTI